MTASNTPDQRIDVILDQIPFRTLDNRWLESIKAQLKAIIEAEIDAIIGEDEVFLDIPVLNGNGEVAYRITGESYTPFMVARNNLRTEQRQRIPQVISKYFNTEER